MNKKTLAKIAAILIGVGAALMALGKAISSLAGGEEPTTTQPAALVQPEEG